MPTVEELLLKISGDSKGGQEALDELTGKMGGMMKGLLSLTGEGLLPMAAAGGAVAAGLLVVGERLYDCTEKAAELGTHFQEMSEKTGASVAGLSNLDYAAKVTGGSLDQISNAMFMLQRNIGEGSPKVEAGLAKIGLSMDEIGKLAPERQFTEIAAALKTIEDPAARAAAVMELFGRQGRDLLPLLSKDLDTLIGDSQKLGYTWTEEDAKGAEEFTMKVNALKLQLAQISTTVGRDLIPVFSELIDLMKEAAPIAVFLTKSFAPLLGIMSQLPEAIRYVSAAWTLFTDNFKLPMDEKAVDARLNAFAKAAGIAVPKVMSLKDAEKELNKELDETAKKSKDAVEAAAKYAEHVKLVEQEVEYQTVGTGKNWEAQVKLRDEVAGRLKSALAEHYELLERLIPATRDWWTQLGAANGEIQVLASHSIPLASGAMVNLGSGVTHLSAQLADAEKNASSFGAGMAKALKDIPNILTKAFTGGGGFTGAVEGLGAQVGGVLSDSIGKRITAGLAPAAGSGGGALSGIMGMFGGTAGLVGSLATGAATMGISLGVQALVSFASKIGKPSKDELAARDMFSKQGFGSVDDFIAAVSKKGGELNMNGELLRQQLQKVLDATHVSAAAEKKAIDELNKSMDDAQKKADATGKSVKAIAPDFDTLAQKAAQFGISLDALGPKFQQANISKTAADYLKTFADLKDAGGDVGGILLGMSDEFSKLVQDSVKFGTALPEAMRPLIQNLIDAKKLTNEQGDAFGDITQIKFDGSPVDTSLDQFQTSVAKTTDQLDGPSGMTAALASVGDAIASNIPVNPFEKWAMPPINLPQMPTYGGPQAKGGDYHVTRPTLFLAGEVKGGEDVSFSGAGKRFAGGGLHVTVQVAGSVWSGQDLGREVHDQLSDILRDRERLRVG